MPAPPFTVAPTLVVDGVADSAPDAPAEPVSDDEMPGNAVGAAVAPPDPVAESEAATPLPEAPAEGDTDAEPVNVAPAALTDGDTEVAPVSDAVVPSKGSSVDASSEAEFVPVAFSTALPAL